MGRPAGMLPRDVQPRNAESARRVAAHTGAIAAPRRWKREGRGNRRLMPELGEGDGSIIVAAPSARAHSTESPAGRGVGPREETGMDDRGGQESGVFAGRLRPWLSRTRRV